MPRKPSARAKRAVKILVENGGKSVSKAMRDAGYSPATAKNPEKLTKTKTWQQLMNEFLPQHKIASVHAAQLDATDARYVTAVVKGRRVRKLEKVPDNQARLRAVEIAYKLRGNFAPEQIEVTKRKYSNMTNAELAEKIARARSVFAKKAK